MDLKDVKELKAKTENDIMLIVNQFEQLTDCGINGIKILRNEFVLKKEIGFTDLKGVAVDVRI